MEVKSGANKSKYTDGAVGGHGALGKECAKLHCSLEEEKWPFSSLIENIIF